MDTHIYSGAQYADTKAPQAIAPTAPKAALQAQTTGMQAVNNNIAGVESDIYDRMEYALDQQRKQYTATVQADIEQTFITALSFPDGHAQSLWNKDGSFKDTYYKNLLTSKLSLLDNLHHGYIRPDSQKAAADQSLDLKTKIKTSIDIKIAQALAPRAKAATIKLANFQAQQGYYDEAIASINGAPAYAFDDIERAAAIRKIQQTRILNTAKTAALTNDPAAYLSILGNKDTMGTLTPEQQNQIYALQSRFADDGPPADKINLSGDNTSSSGTTKRAAHPLPLGSTDDLVELHQRWLDENGNYPKEGEATRQAISALDSYASRFVTPNLTENDRLHFYNIAECFGINKEDAKTILDRHYAPFEMTSNGFDYDKALKNLDQNYFTATWAQRNYTNAYNNLTQATAAFNSVEHLKDSSDPKDKTGYSSAYSALKEAEANMQLADSFKKEWQQKRLAQIKKEYADWFILQDKTKLTDIDCRMKLYDIADSVMDAAADSQDALTSNPWDISSSSEYRLTRQQWESAQSARRAATANRAALDAETAEYDELRAYAAAEASLSQKTQFSGSASFPVSQTDAQNLPDSATSAYLAVPKGSHMAGRKLALRFNRRTHEIPCIESDCATPTLSQRAQLNLGIFNSNTVYSIAHDATGRAVLTSHAVADSQKDIYNIMLSQEIRRDSSGRPMVYQLPAADGGGTYEVAGLNDKYNPAEAQALKAMIQSGAPTPAIESFIRAAYKQKTQFGANYLPPSHSQGLELFLRDCSLNHSERGVRTILARAVGTRRDDPALPAAIQKYISTHGERALLNKLSIARGAYYQSLIQANPARAIFADGWNNRNKNITNAAYSLLYTPSSN